MAVRNPMGAIRRFLQLESAGGLILMAAAAFALILANLPGVSGLYRDLLHLDVYVKFGNLVLDKNLLLIINDGLMAIFFLLVALEIKREIVEGELSTVRQVALPGFAAVGGLAVPAIIYTMFNGADAIASRGWAIPAATDIAFSLGVLSLLGSRVPLALKVFLTTVAVVDDLAAIVIIALFYTSKLSVAALMCGLVGLVILIVLNLARVRSMAPFYIVGFIMWVCVLKSGVHATLAGVALGFTIPFAVRDEDGETHSPLKHLEHALHPWVAFMILPLFAFANSGVSFAGLPSEAFFGPITLGIALGLLLGKPVGIVLACFLAVKTGLASLPSNLNWKAMAGVGMLCGIGFTMSLFIGTLAFEGQGLEYEAATRIGVFGGSILSALAGLFLLKAVLREE